MVMPKKERLMPNLGQALEMARSGKYGDSADIQVALILKDATVSSDFIVKQPLCVELDRLCKMAFRKKSMP